MGIAIAILLTFILLPAILTVVAIIIRDHNDR